MKGQLILASASPRRRELLQQIGLEFEVLTSDAPEITSAVEPKDIVMDLSRQKALAVQKLLEKENGPSSRKTISLSGKYPVLLGADTIVFSGSRVLGKPADQAEAFSMLEQLSGRTHQVYTGVTLLCGRKSRSFYECTQVECYPMTPEEIHSYIQTGDSMDKAGAYGIQGPFAAFVKGIRGDYNNVVGLPVSRVYQELKTFPDP